MDIKKRSKSTKTEEAKPAGSSSSSSNAKKDPSTKSDHKSKSTSKSSAPATSASTDPASLFPKHRVWSRTVLVLGVLLVVYFTNSKYKQSIYAEYKDDLSRGKGFDVKCTPKYKDTLKFYPGVTPVNCGRVVVDQVIMDTNPFLHVIKQIVSKQFKNMPPPIAIIDLGKWTLNSYEVQGGETEQMDLSYIPPSKDFIDAYKILHRRIKHLTTHHYQINGEKIHLAEPSFITILTGKNSAVDYTSQYTMDQELNNGTFHFSSKIFLNDQPVEDDQRGKFVFSDKDNVHRIVHPKKGRAVVYTSGPENIYFVEPSEKGSLVFLTIAFTANPKQALRNRILLE